MVTKRIVLEIEVVRESIDAVGLMRGYLDACKGKGQFELPWSGMTAVEVFEVPPAVDEEKWKGLAVSWLMDALRECGISPSKKSDLRKAMREGVDRICDVAVMYLSPSAPSKRMKKAVEELLGRNPQLKIKTEDVEEELRKILRTKPSAGDLETPPPSGELVAAIKEVGAIYRRRLEKYGNQSVELEHTVEHFDRLEKLIPSEDETRESMVAITADHVHEWVTGEISNHYFSYLLGMAEEGYFTPHANAGVNTEEDD